MDAAIEKSAMRKVYMRLLPFANAGSGNPELTVRFHADQGDRAGAPIRAEGNPTFSRCSRARLISLEVPDEHGPDQRKLETIRRKGKGDLGTIDRR
jgi:hypothetical protein